MVIHTYSPPIKVTRRKKKYSHLPTFKERAPTAVHIHVFIQHSPSLLQPRQILQSLRRQHCADISVGCSS